MKKYQHKPTVVEAIQFTGSNAIDEMVKAWGTDFSKRYMRKVPSTMEISTLEGIMNACVGDWIVKGTRGCFYPVNQDLFYDLYKEVA